MGVLVFVILASLVLSGAALGLDEPILSALRDRSDSTLPRGPSWLRELGRDITALGSTGILVIIALLVTGHLSLAQKPGLALRTAIVLSSGAALTFALKWAFHRVRPPSAPPDIYTRATSFPSGHTMMSAITYLTLAALYTRTQTQPRMRNYTMTVAATLVALVGISRVYLGVHWPTDVLAGAAAGTTWALFCWQTLLRPRVRPHRSTPEHAEIEDGI